MAKIEETVFALEALVDKHGLRHVLVALELMCGEKVDHIETNWPSRISEAKPWERAKKMIGSLANKVEELDI